MDIIGDFIGVIVMIVFIIVGGGVFKQVLVDSGVGYYILYLMIGIIFLLLLMCWIVVVLLCIVLGFVIVVVIIIVGVVLLIINVIYVDFVLMVLVIGVGSVIVLYVNDFGFWLFKGYFNLMVGEMLCIWMVMEIFIFIMGLLGVLVINVVLY